MKLRLPVRLMRAVPAGARAAAHATLASGFLCMGAVFFSFSAHGQGDPIAILVEDDELAVPVEDEAADELTLAGSCGAAAQDDSQAEALAESEQNHAAELGINATSSVVSQAAIAAQDVAAAPAQAAGSGRAYSAAAVLPVEISTAVAEGAVAPSLCAKGTLL